MTQELLQRNDRNLAKREDTRSVNGSIHIQNVFDMIQETETTEKHIKSFTEQLEKLISKNHNINGNIIISNTFTDRATDQDGLSEDVLSRLRKAAEGITRPGADHATPNPFEFAARILRLPEQNEDQVMVCAIFDTGSAENLISSSVIDRAALLDRVEQPPETSIRGADGNFLEPTGSISITWSRNSKQSWQTDFLVVDNPPFDMLLGRKFIVAEGVFVFSDPVLVADHSRLSTLSKGRKTPCCPIP
jgi:hypothetical protein